MGIIILLVTCSIFAALEYIMLKKEKKYFFHAASFYLLCNLFILSAMKYLLGYHKENLLESFWNIQTLTYIHYGIPMIILNIFMPIFIHFVFRNNDWKIIRFFDSTIFFSLSYTYFLVREINNKTYCIAFLIAFLVTLFLLGYICKHEIVYIYPNKKNSRMHFKRMFLYLFYWIVTIVIYIPNELYLNNAEEFPMSYWYFFGKLLLASVIALLVLGFGTVLYLTEKQFDIFGTVLFALLTIGYVQGMFLNGSMGVLDGTRQAWNTSAIIINLVIWVVLFIGIILVKYMKKDLAQRVMSMICIWLTLTQLVSLGVLILSSNDVKAKSEIMLTTDGMLEVGEANNIIVFVLDKFDGRRMDEILEEDSDFLAPLKDFTYFDNASSEFCPTEYSIPFLLTGTEYNGNPEDYYTEYAYDEKCLLKDLKKYGYDIGVYTNKRYVPEEMKDIVSNYKAGIKRTCKTGELFALMQQCSKYRMSPFALKNYYQYDTSDIALLVEDERITNIENDLPFYSSLTEKGLTVKENTQKGVFRFIHMHGAHPPYIMTEEFQYLEYDPRRDEHEGNGISQAKGALKIVYEYIRQLKELDKYDDAMIIITADHGYTEALNDENGNVVNISFPILFIKEPKDKNENLKISNAPVCHADLMPTIRKTMGMDIEEKTIWEVEGERTRFMKGVHFSEGLFQEYEINGNVRDIDSWKLLFTTK